MQLRGTLCTGSVDKSCADVPADDGLSSTFELNAVTDSVPHGMSNHCKATGSPLPQRWQSSYIGGPKFLGSLTSSLLTYVAVSVLIAIIPTVVNAAMWNGKHKQLSPCTCMQQHDYCTNVVPATHEECQHCSF